MAPRPITSMKVTALTAATIRLVVSSRSCGRRAPGHHRLDARAPWRGHRRAAATALAFMIPSPIEAMAMRRMSMRRALGGQVGRDLGDADRRQEAGRGLRRPLAGSTDGGAVAAEVAGDGAHARRRVPVAIVGGQVAHASRTAPTGDTSTLGDPGAEAAA